MRTTSFAASARALLACLLFVSGAAYADEVRVMTSGGMAAAYLELAPHFERASGHRVVTETTSIGIGVDYIPTRVQRGEPVDVVLLPAAAMDQLIKDGKVLADSRVDLARSGIGMAVRAGAPRPDIRSVDALKRALLEARSIAYSSSVSGTYLSDELFPRLGIAEQVKDKSRRIERERVGAVVARGDAEIGFQQISELLPIEGIDYVGPLPTEVQRVTVFSAGVAAQARSPEAARALIRFLASPEGARVMAKGGLEPIVPR
jgi:molybdate transport system substrate-binding protein